MCDDQCKIDYLYALIKDAEAKQAKSVAEKADLDKQELLFINRVSTFIKDPNPNPIISATPGVIPPRSRPIKQLTQLTLLNDQVLAELFSQALTPTVTVPLVTSEIAQSIHARFHYIFSPLAQLLCRFPEHVKYKKLKTILLLLGFDNTKLYPIQLVYSILAFICRPSFTGVLAVAKVVKSKTPSQEPVSIQPKVSSSTVYRSIKDASFSSMLDKVNSPDNSYQQKLGYAALLTGAMTTRIVGLPAFKWFNIAKIPVASNGKALASELSSKAWTRVGELGLANIQEKRAKFSEIYQELKAQHMTVDDKKVASLWSNILNNNIIKTGNNISVKASPGIVCLTLAFFAFMNSDALSEFIETTFQQGGGKNKRKQPKHKQVGGSVLEAITQYSNTVSTYTREDSQQHGLLIDMFYGDILKKANAIYEIIDQPEPVVVDLE